MARIFRRSRGLVLKLMFVAVAVNIVVAVINIESLGNLLWRSEGETKLVPRLQVKDNSNASKLGEEVDDIFKMPELNKESEVSVKDHLPGEHVEKKVGPIVLEEKQVEAIAEDQGDLVVEPAGKKDGDEVDEGIRGDEIHEVDDKGGEKDGGGEEKQPHGDVEVEGEEEDNDDNKALKKNVPDKGEEQNEGAEQQEGAEQHEGVEQQANDGDLKKEAEAAGGNGEQPNEETREGVVQPGVIPGAEVPVQAYVPPGADLDIVVRDPINGPGERGQAVEIDEKKLNKDDRQRYGQGWKHNAFNEYVSDMISLHRSLPNLPDSEKCKAEKYHP
ncbi:nucleoprotein TPR, partial [Aplysia californica]|uniref:Nucleoprotein TPR n=1 Tax=Aplysia californica TaxID=6500 RepID=A0ABM0JAE1_APLCA